MNPDTGKVMAYEEVWRDIPGSGTGYILLESVGENNKTYIGRVGNYFQGIGTQGSRVCAKRAEFKDGNWETTFSIGDGNFLPLFDEHNIIWKEGDEIECNGRLWKVLDYGK